jgi:hypothetical protein
MYLKKYLEENLEREKEVFALWPKLDKKGKQYFSGYIEKASLKKMLDVCQEEKINIVVFFNKFWRSKNGRPKLLGFVTKEKK